MAFETSGVCVPGIKYALINNNAVSDIFDGANLPTYSATSIKLIALPKGEEYKYSIGQTLNENGELEELTLDQAKQIQILKICNAFEQAVYQTQTSYIPLEETLTFELQYQEAKLVGSDNPTPFLDQLAQSRNEDKQQLAKKILEKHDAYINKLALLLGAKSKAIKQVESCNSLEAVLEVNYSA
ncbi:hypothetical protein [Helicobacter suis]|uniref:hypothetical protein n=1 Tax=Helicobacter suis TaxID=104628 RepID=UPI0013D4AD46|nr:hypothetical protein [Helicobacter suis]